VKKALKIFLCLLIVTFCGMAGWVTSMSLNLPSVVGLRESVGSDLAHRDATYVPLDQLPTGLVSGLVAVEDKRFYEHHGIDWFRVAGALWANIEAHRMAQGGSTITEQLVENTLLRDEERGLPKKVRAMLLARRVEQAYTKDQILELYFNAVYYGAGSYGIDAASRNYFGQPPRRLDSVQQLFLAGVVQGPALYDPSAHCSATRRRLDTVITAQLDAGTLSTDEAERLQGAPLVYINGLCQA
jgi:penicillin-binding protein 1A